MVDLVWILPPAIFAGGMLLLLGYDLGVRHAQNGYDKWHPILVGFIKRFYQKRFEQTLKKKTDTILVPITEDFFETKA